MRVVVISMTVRIGPAFRVEGGDNGRHGGAEMTDHVFDDRIAANAQAVAAEFGRQVAIAEVPGDTEQTVRPRRDDLGQRLRRGIDGDDAVVLEYQGVAIPQRQGLSQIEQEFQSAGGGHRHAAAVPLIVVEDDTIGRFVGPLPCGKNAGGADHRVAIWLIGSSRDTTSRPRGQTVKS